MPTPAGSGSRRPRPAPPLASPPLAGMSSTRARSPIQHSHHHLTRIGTARPALHPAGAPGGYESADSDEKEEDGEDGEDGTGYRGGGGGGDETMMTMMMRMDADTQMMTMEPGAGAAAGGGGGGGGETDADRRAKDEFLVRSKIEGLTYRQIREKGGFVEAESTLRGRFRTLTKNKEDRVRRPKWSEKDVSGDGTQRCCRASPLPPTLPPPPPNIPSLSSLSPISVPPFPDIHTRTTTLPLPSLLT